MSRELFNTARGSLSFSQSLRDRVTGAAKGASNFFQAVPGATAGMMGKMAQETAKMPLRAGGAMIDVGRQAMGQQPLPRTNIPGLGEFATPARNTYDESMKTNDPMQLAASGIKNASMGILDAAGTGGMANLAVGAKNMAGTVGRHITSAKQILTEMPNVPKGELAKRTLINTKDAVAHEAGQGLYGKAGDVMAATSQAGEVLSDAIPEGDDEEEFDEETVGALGAALGTNKVSQEALKQERDRLQNVIMHTWDKPKVRSRAMKAFKLISKLIK